MRRISVIGTTGSGKSTLARDLSEKLGFLCVELDAVNWQPNWTPIDASDFAKRVAEAAAMDCWVIEGGYSKVRPLIWARADTVVWLDYPFHTVFWRLLSRTVRRCVGKEELWNGNRESINMVFSSDSIILWLFRTYWRRKKRFPALLGLPENQHLNVLRFQSPKETIEWLKDLK